MNKRNLNRVRKVMRTRVGGFTLMELVLVIAILGVLAVSALPSMFSIPLTTARSNAMRATIGAVQTGLALYAANQVSQGLAITYPATLDSATTGAATGTNRFFSTVLQNGINAQWFKVSATCYVFDNNGNGTMDAGTTDIYFQYTIATGAVAQISTCT